MHASPVLNRGRRAPMQSERSTIDRVHAGLWSGPNGGAPSGELLGVIRGSGWIRRCDGRRGTVRWPRSCRRVRRRRGRTGRTGSSSSSAAAAPASRPREHSRRRGATRCPKPPWLPPRTERHAGARATGAKGRSRASRDGPRAAILEWNCGDREVTGAGGTGSTAQAHQDEVHVASVAVRGPELEAPTIDAREHVGR